MSLCVKNFIDVYDKKQTNNISPSLCKIKTNTKNKWNELVDFNNITKISKTTTHNHTNSKSTWISQKNSSHSNDSLINYDKTFKKNKSHTLKEKTPNKSPSITVNHYSSKEIKKLNTLNSPILDKSLTNKKETCFSVSQIINKIKKVRGTPNEMNLSKSNFFRSYSSKMNRVNHKTSISRFGY